MKSTNMTSNNIRKCLKIIRVSETCPSTILPNGLTAEKTAFDYVLSGTHARKKRKKRKKKQ